MTIEEEATARALRRFRAKVGKNASIPNATNASKARQMFWANLLRNAKEEITKERAQQAKVVSAQTQSQSYDVLTVRENGQEKLSLLTSSQLDHLIHVHGIAAEISLADIDATIKEHGSIVYRSSTPGTKIHMEIKLHRRSMLDHFRALLQIVMN
jgi:hypothetical protein